MSFLPFTPNLNLPRNSTAIKIAGTDTFRLSSSKILRQYGTNLQNPSDEIRRIYIPSEGYIFNQRDQAGADAKIVAYLCKHGNFRELFLQGIKPHVYVALHVFANYWARELQVSAEFFDSTYLRAAIKDLKHTDRWKELETKIKKHDEYYFIGKKICHSSNYAMGANTFALDVLAESEGQVIITKSQAEHFLYVYHNLFPEIRIWHREVQEQLTATRTLYTLQGFPRYFNQKDLDEQLWKVAYAFVPQATVAVINNSGFTKMQNIIEEQDLDCNILNNMHDSILVESSLKNELYKLYDPILASCLEQDLVSPRGEQFKMGTEGMFGMNWGKYKSECKNCKQSREGCNCENFNEVGENPNGLKEIK